MDIFFLPFYNDSEMTPEKKRLIATLFNAVWWFYQHGESMDGFADWLKTSGATAPPQTLTPLTTGTNQAAINLFSKAAGKNGDPPAYIEWLTRAGLSDICTFARRSEKWAGPPVELLPHLTLTEKARLIAAIHQTG